MRHFVALGALLALAPATGTFAQQAPGQQAAIAPAPAAATPSAEAPAATAGPTAGETAVADLPPGQRVLNLCRACHTLDPGARTLIGPNLHGIFGRRAGSVEGYRYSAGMRQLGETGHVWSEETIRRWVSNPQAMVPRTAMKFPGLPDPQQINDLIPFLKEATGGS